MGRMIHLDASYSLIYSTLFVESIRNRVNEEEPICYAKALQAAPFLFTTEGGKV